MTEMDPLDKRLQEYAMSNWEAFCGLAGFDKRRAMVCLLRMEGKTFGQIAAKLGISKSTVQRTLNKCVSGTDTKSCKK